MRFVRVLWGDAQHFEALNPGEDGGVIEGVAAGIVVADTEEFITLALEAFEDGDYRQCITIAKPMVRDIEDLCPVPHRVVDLGAAVLDILAP